MMASPSAPARRGRRSYVLDSLSERERQVLDGVVRGLTNKQIAIELGISHRTVEIHRARLMRKLDVTSIAALLTLVLAGSGRPPSKEPAPQPGSRDTD